MATLKDVASLASVSTSTASRILHGGNIRVSPETRQRVTQAAESLSYQANSLARSLRTRVTRTIGFLIPDIQNPVYSQMIAGAEEAAQAQGYALLLMNSSSGERRRAFIELLAQDRLDGLIIADATLDDEWIDRLEAAGRTYLLVNRRSGPAAPYVVLDEQAGAGLAIQHLIELGHKEIAYFAGPPLVETSQQRLLGAKLTCEKHGVSLPDSRIISCGYGGEGIEAAVEKILEKEPQVTAIATASIVMAFAVAKAVTARGLKIPEDISLIGYHDTHLAELVQPGITTVEMPLVELGRHTMRNILSRANGLPVANEVITTPGPKLILRQSTGSPKVGKSIA